MASYKWFDQFRSMYMYCHILGYTYDCISVSHHIETRSKISCSVEPPSLHTFNCTFLNRHLLLYHHILTYNKINCCKLLKRHLQMLCIFSCTVHLIIVSQCIAIFLRTVSYRLTATLQCTVNVDLQLRIVKQSPGNVSYPLRNRFISFKVNC